MSVSRKNFLYYIMAAVGLLTAWWFAACAIQLPVIPSPFSVFQKLQDIFLSDIALHGIYSLVRIIGGVMSAILIGYPLGLAAGYYSQADKIFSPLIYLTYPLPKVALLPIIMLLFGVGEISKLLLIFSIVVFQIVISVRDSIHFIPEESFAVLHSLGAPFFYIFRKIIFPASLPKFFSALRISMATAISVLFFTETFGTQYGMGYYIMDAWLRVNYLEMYCGIVVLSIMGISIFALIDFCEKYFCQWQFLSSD